MTATEPDLSIVIPAWNEAQRLLPTLRRILAWADGRTSTLEVIVVDDGSTDDTAEVTERLAEQDPRIRCVRQPRNLGKGAAVSAGVEAARGRLVLMSDADLSTPIEEFVRLERALENADIAIGSRAVDRSLVRVRQHASREWLGRAFNLVVQAMAVPGVKDTQCGFKLFPRPIAQRLFALRTLDRFAFDVEILHLAQRLGLRIAEVPVLWYNDEASTVRPIRDGLTMVREVTRIRWTHRQLNPSSDRA